MLRDGKRLSKVSPQGGVSMALLIHDSVIFTLHPAEQFCLTVQMEITIALPFIKRYVYMCT